MRMPEPTERSAIAQSPLTIILFAKALSTETEEALRSWQHYLLTLHRSYEMILVQEARPEVPPPDHQVPPTRTICYDPAPGWGVAINEAIRSARSRLRVFSP